MSPTAVSRKTLALVLLATTAALVARSWLQVTLRDQGMLPSTAADLSYLVVPLVLLVLLFPCWRTDKNYLAGLFRQQHLSCRIVARAVLIGVLLRVVAWCELLASVSFGRYVNADANAIVGPSFGFDCPAAELLMLGVLVMILLVPLIEEIVHRGIVMGAFDNLAPVITILLSAIIFMVFHKPGSWIFSGFAGVVFGMLFWSTRSLWSGLIAHATVNGLIQIDWRCLSGHWNPKVETLPLIVPGIAALAVGLFSVALIVLILRKTMAEKTIAEANPPPRRLFG